jgi:hypothetical protein
MSLRNLEDQKNNYSVFIQSTTDNMSNAAVSVNAKKIAPEVDEESSNTLNTASSDDAKVPVFGELITQIQTPSPDGGAVAESFDGSNLDLTKSPFPINNDLFDGLVHIMMRDLPGNTYTFDGEKQVLWEIQIQVGFGHIKRFLERRFGK